MEDNSDSHDENKLDETFEFPEVVLNQISECTPEGFLLFTISEHGEVELFSRSGTDIVESGLRVKALKILGALSMMEDNEIASSIFQQRGNPNQIRPTDEGSDEDSE